MNEFAVVWQHRDLIIEGFENTLAIVAVSSVAALVLGALLTIPLMSRNAGIRRLAMIYVDAMRCVPFLLFVYLLYFGFPSIGLRFDNWTAGVIALVLYNTAYMAELLRAGGATVDVHVSPAGLGLVPQDIALVRQWLA